MQVWLIWRRWGYGLNVDGVKDVVKGKMGVEELKKNVKEIFAKPVRGQEG